MDENTQERWEQLTSLDKDTRYEAFLALKEATAQPVTWAYEIWDQLIDWLQSGDNHQRAIAAQFLAQLAISDPENRMARDVDVVFAITRDEKFVTARHALQSFWKIGLASPELRTEVVNRLSQRFHDCLPEKNYTLIRFDIIVSLAQLANATGDGSIPSMAKNLAESETDLKYRKKYLGALK